MCTQYTLLKYLNPFPPNKSKSMYTMPHDYTKILNAAFHLVLFQNDDILP